MPPPNVVEGNLRDQAPQAANLPRGAAPAAPPAPLQNVDNPPPAGQPVLAPGTPVAGCFAVGPHPQGFLTFVDVQPLC